MDSFTDPEVREGWLMKSAQIAWTSSLENILGYFIDQDPAPIMLIQPTVQVAEDFSKTRLAPMVRDSPRLAAKISEAKSRDADNTILRKKFRGGHLVLAGANAPSGLASHPIRILLYDEVDRYPPSAGVEGDPLAISYKRTQNFWNRKIGGGSTPTIKGASLIEAKFELGDQRRWYVPCVHCGGRQALKWSQVKFEPNEPESARYLCEHCGTLWSDVERWAGICAGSFVPHAPFKGIRSWHLNAVTSTFVRLEDMVREFAETKGKPEKLKTFVNLSLGETWEETGSTIEPGSLLERREQYGPDNIPEAVLLLTAGVDVQDDRIEVQVNGWGVDEENWPIEQKVFRGDPGKPQLWLEVDDYLVRQFETEDGRQLLIEAVAIDSGGHFTQAVYQFVVSRKRRRVWAIKGKAGPGRLAWPKKASKTAKSRANVFILGVDTIKGVLYGRLSKIPEPGPGYIHLPHSADDEFCKQLTSEKAITKYVRGRAALVWEPRSSSIAQEVQDCWVYAYAAMIGRGGPELLKRRSKSPRVKTTKRIDTPEDKTPVIDEVIEARPAPAPRATSTFRRNGWFKKR